MDVQVKFDKETVWLSQKEIAMLFDKDSDTIGLHLRNIYKTEELTKNSTTEKSSVVQKEGSREVKRTINLYNLDAIISVGYRINSKKGTQFRIWATSQLKQHLIKGYTINEKRLKQLQQTIQLVNRASKQISNTDEAQGLMEVLSDYSRALDILDD